MRRHRSEMFQGGDRLTGGVKRSIMSQKVLTVCLAAASLAFSGVAVAQEAETKPDHTKVNKRDRDAASPTANQQKDNK